MPIGAPGDTRTRKRVSTVVGRPNGLASLNAVASEANKDIAFCDKHFVTLVTFGAITAGIVNVRARPVHSADAVAAATGPANAIPIGIEAVNLFTATQFNFEVNGFFEAFELKVTTALTGTNPKVIAVINSVQTNG